MSIVWYFSWKSEQWHSIATGTAMLSWIICWGVFSTVHDHDQPFTVKGDTSGRNLRMSTKRTVACKCSHLQMFCCLQQMPEETLPGQKRHNIPYTSRCKSLDVSLTSLQSFADMASPAKMTVTRRTVSKLCTNKNMLPTSSFLLELISWVHPRLAHQLVTSCIAGTNIRLTS